MRVHIRVLVLVFALAVPTFQAGTPISPCPMVFMYEPPGAEEDRWYGNIYLTTDTTLNSLLLNIIVDKKANLLGNWIGELSTKDNMNFVIENPDIKIKPGPATKVRFFVQFTALCGAPKLKIIKLNGREICNIDKPQPFIDFDESRAFKLETTTKARGWDDIWPEDAMKPRKGQAVLTDSRMNFVDYSKKPFTSSSSSVNNDVEFQNVNPGYNSALYRTAALTTQATQIPARIPVPAEPQYDDDDDASYDENRKDYFDGRLLIRPVNGAQ